MRDVGGGGGGVLYSDFPPILLNTYALRASAGHLFSIRQIFVYSSIGQGGGWPLEVFCLALLRKVRRHPRSLLGPTPPLSNGKNGQPIKGFLQREAYCAFAIDAARSGS